MATVNERQRRSWTVLVYLIADDPQGGDLFDQLAHRELDSIVYGTTAADKNDRLNVAVQVDFRNQPYVWRRVIREGTWEQPESNAADPATLYGFFDWAVRKCPAEHYALILWGHSAGPFGLFTDDDVRTYVAQTLTMNELRDALEAAATAIHKKVDLVAFKDCVMSTIEIAREIDEVATYVLASQSLVPAEGWPYKQLFAALSRGSSVDDSVRGAANALTEYYALPKNRGNNAEVPYSLLDLRKSGELVEPLRKLVQCIVDDDDQKRTNSPLQDALRAAALPNEKAMIDVRLFCAALQKCGDSRLRDRAAQVDKAVSYLVARAPTSERFTGINAFCYPVDAEEQRNSRMAKNASETVYRGLSHSTETKWSSIALAAKIPPPSFSKRRQTVGTRSANGELLPQAVARLRQQGVAEQLQVDTLTFIAQALNTLDQNGGGPGILPAFDLTSIAAALRALNLGLPSDKTGNLGSDKTGNLDSDKTGNLESDFRLLQDDDDDDGPGGGDGPRPNGRPTM